MRNIPVKLNEILTGGSGGDVVKNISYQELWQPLEPFVKFLWNTSLGTIL